ncbi:MAG: ThuA domain-containing protein, partial [Planctomycetota bacterium]|nr:ThuA domain-containing protein [Planctomycetota bacterium]
WAKENPWLEVVVDRSPEQFSKENLADFDAIFLYTTGELPWPEGGKLALLDFVQNGGALIGAHCASDTFYEWPEFGELLGGYFNGHPWHEEVGIKVEDPDHLSTQNLPTSFEIVDEIYQFKDWTREGKRVLLSLDTDSVDMTRPTIRREDGDFGITWTRRHGKGRIFYTALGHRPEVWKSTLFQEHLLGGTLWATRK